MDIFCVKVHNAKHVSEYMLSLEEVGIDLPCTARSIIYNVLGISGRIANLVKRYLMKQKLPFRQTFDFKNLNQVVVWDID